MMDRPLNNIQIVITRDPAQSGDLTEKLSSLGGNVFAIPTIRIIPPEDWSSCDSVIERIGEYDWIVFTSVNGVRFFIDRVKEKKSLERIRASFAAVGRKTGNILDSSRFSPNLIPDHHSAEGLLESFKDLNLHDKKMLIPTSDLAGEILPEGLRSMGAIVDKVVCYRTAGPEAETAGRMIESLKERKTDCFTFYSPSSFRSMLELLEKKQLQDLLRMNTALAAIGPSTAETIRNAGYEVKIFPEKSHDESMVDAIVSYFTQKKTDHVR